MKMKQVGIIMGSKSDLPVMQKAIDNYKRAPKGKCAFIHLIQNANICTIIFCHSEPIERRRFQVTGGIQQLLQHLFT